MTFEELFDKACESTGLPEMAKLQLPNSLSDKTKKMVIQLFPDKLGCVLNKVIETVSNGSVESINKLVRKQVRR